MIISQKLLYECVNMNICFYNWEFVRVGEHLVGLCHSVCGVQGEKTQGIQKAQQDGSSTLLETNKGLGNCINNQEQVI